MEISGIGVITAFVAGIISFLSPCVLPLVPGYVSYVAGESLDDLTTADFSRRRLSAILLSVFFVLGFSTVFVSLGASATALGEFFLAYRVEANYVAGAVVILFGLFLTGLVPIPWLSREARFNAHFAGGHPAGHVIPSTVRASTPFLVLTSGRSSSRLWK